MNPTYVQACTNGRLHDAREPSISPLSRGFLYGDAIYEVWRTYDGGVFAWDEHWQRLQQSAASLHFKLPLTPADALEEIKRTVSAYQQVNDTSGEYYIRLQITRGSGAIGLDPALADQPDYVVLVQRNTLYSEEKFRSGLHLSLATQLRRNPVEALNPAWKTGNYLNNIMCLREARQRGADEVVITSLAGELTEAAVSNIAFVRNGEVLTPPMSAGLLRGITRELTIRQIGPRAGVSVHEVTIRPEDISQMQECFIMSTTKDITPVSSIDGQPFTVGAGTVTSRLKAAFADYVSEYGSKHPELRISR